MLIKPSDLSTEAIHNLAREWVVANLSDTESEPDLEAWTLQAVAMVMKGEMFVEFSELDESVTLKSKEAVSAMQSEEGKAHE
jgi:uncharacterized protein YheU (UPF0270 family)